MAKRADRETMVIEANDVGSVESVLGASAPGEPKPAVVEYSVAPGKTLKCRRGTLREGEAVFSTDFESEGQLMALVEKSCVLARQVPAPSEQP